MGRVWEVQQERGGKQDCGGGRKQGKLIKKSCYIALYSANIIEIEQRGRNYFRGGCKLGVEVGEVGGSYPLSPPLY